MLERRVSTVPFLAQNLRNLSPRSQLEEMDHA